LDASVWGRQVFNRHTASFREYDMEGPVQPEMSWLPISYDDEATGQGCYAMRTQPGAVTISHEHAGMEEFLILDGDLIDDDGIVFGPGDFVSYEPGTTHNSRTENGCLIAVFEWRPPAQSAP
jgi:anti-sigma factor ChrR (cupin superfamily)